MYAKSVEYQYWVRIAIPGYQGALTERNEQGKTREWVEENIAAPRRAGKDILFQGEVLNWKYHIKSIHIYRVSRDEGPYSQGRRRDRTQPSTVDVTHEFITGAPGEYTPGRDNASNTLADFSNDELIEELRRRLG